MKGRTTVDYEDRAFGALVTRHLGECVREGRPICYDIRAELDGEPYEYTRLTLPLSLDGNRVDMILAGTLRGVVPKRVMRAIVGLADSDSYHLARSLPVATTGESKYVSAAYPPRIARRTLGTRES
jgi:hypothetical protein